MRNLFKSLRALGPMTAALALLASSPAAQAADPMELNFGLFGPKYDGRVAECERALTTIAAQFQEKESEFWNSALDDHRVTAGSTKPRFGLGSPTTFRAAIAAVT